MLNQDNSELGRLIRRGRFGLYVIFWLVVVVMVGVTILGISDDHRPGCKEYFATHPAAAHCP